MAYERHDVIFLSTSTPVENDINFTVTDFKTKIFRSIWTRLCSRKQKADLVAVAL